MILPSQDDFPRSRLHPMNPVDQTDNERNSQLSRKGRSCLGKATGLVQQFDPEERNASLELPRRRSFKPTKSRLRAPPSRFLQRHRSRTRAAVAPMNRNLRVA